MAVSFLFLIAGLIIMTGFFGNLFFEKTRISDVLVLLGIGILLGPVFGLVNPSMLTHFAEYFGTLALIIILFEGGMNMDLDKMIKEFGTASLLVLLSFFLSTLAIAAFLNQTQGWDLRVSLLLGIILGCTSAAIVIPIISRMSLKEEIKTIISLESALSDVLAVVFTLLLIEFITLGDVGIKAPFRAVANSFSTAIIAGVMIGLFWLKMLDLFRGKKYSYMVTLAAVLITFSVVDFFGGSGAIAVLVFGLILGNSHDFGRFLKLRGHNLIDDTIKFFHGEMTFFIRTFFFVYMGMIVTLRDINGRFLLLSCSLFLIILLVRYLSVGSTVMLYREKKRDIFTMWCMLPRGLASAVLATLPAAARIEGSESFVDLTFAIIILTNLVMTIGVFLSNKRNRKESGLIDCGL
jgi:cell volume regulation protein A